MSTALNIAKINLKESKAAYLTTAIILIMTTISTFISGFDFSVGITTSTASGGTISVAFGDYFYLLLILMSILIPAKHFSKLMHLGGTRANFFQSCIMSYLPVITVVSLIVTAMQFLLYPYLTEHGILMLCTAEVFGFAAHGAIICFFQTFAFLTLLCCTLHTLTLIQGYWYGYAIDIIIIAIISVFTPIAPLRAALVWFFNLIIFGENVTLQILSCLLIGAVVYSLSIIPIRTKRI
jgi:hypothetical protein